MLDYSLDSSCVEPSRQRTDRWRQADPDAMALIESRLAAMLARRRCEPSGQALPAITLTEHRRLLRRNRLFHARKRLRDQGLPLFCAELIGRRLGRKAARRWATVRLHALERARLQ